jgi:hypothetical protein
MPATKTGKKIRMSIAAFDQCRGVAQDEPANPFNAILSVVHLAIKFDVH